MNQNTKPKFQEIEDRTSTASCSWNRLVTFQHISFTYAGRERWQNEYQWLFSLFETNLFVSLMCPERRMAESPCTPWIEWTAKLLRRISSWRYSRSATLMTWKSLLQTLNFNKRKQIKMSTTYHFNEWSTQVLVDGFSACNLIQMPSIHKLWILKATFVLFFWVTEQTWWCPLNVNSLWIRGIHIKLQHKMENTLEQRNSFWTLCFDTS